MGLWRSRATLSAFVPAPADTGWLPGDNGNLGRRSARVKVVAEESGTSSRASADRPRKELRRAAAGLRHGRGP